MELDSYEAGRMEFKPGKEVPYPTGQSVEWWRGYYTAWYEYDYQNACKLLETVDNPPNV